MKELILSAIIGAAVLGAVGVGIHQYGKQKMESGREEVRKEWNTANAKADAKNRATEAEQARKQTEALAHAAEALLNSQNDLAAARTAGDRLRIALDAARKRAASQGGTVITVGPSVEGGDSIGVFADLLTRADAREERISLYADRLRIAGIACERSYDALTSP